MPASPNSPIQRAGSRLLARFALARHGATLHREVVAGITTFLTMSYIIVVNPAILRAAGIPPGASMVATIVTAIFGTVIMALYANRPFAVAPYMGENAFIAYTVVQALGYRWQAALAAVFIAGVLFLLLTIFRLRQWLVSALPESLRYSFAVGIGLFLAFVGLNESGIVTIGVPGAPLKAGSLISPPVLLALAGFLLIIMLLIRRFPGAILIGIVGTTILGVAAGVTPPPRAWISAPPSLAPVFLQLDFSQVFSWSFFPSC